MISLDTFDFNSTCETPGRLDYRELPREHLELLANLEQASAENNLLAVKECFESLRRTHANPDILAKPGSAFQIAVDRQCEEIVRYFLCQGVQVLASHIKSAIVSRSRPIIKQLLEHGWPINAQLGWSEPPILAYATDDFELAAWLLDYGADPNASSTLNKTPLSAAVTHSPLDVIEMLFAKGGNVNEGQLLHYAMWRQQADRSAVVKYILQQGADINALMYRDHRESFVHREPFGIGAPLHEAAAAGDVEVIKLLLDNGADKSVRDTRGRLPYERAQQEGHTVAVELLQNDMSRV
ncbi:Putative ankyrin repeat-containing domain superfamily [Septoria linicola]|uniref:Ankyrin repeat-containing domain superfamily n=1 Tax=Septoria linicola TaxID=215465 RepID=A0A9Q9ELI3_9PEZI|nr:putative ankyrin repeat-containing domain superfamily [Septoria linicola]USW54374.1 Putative ankyrin repeat-containing domain superfamily [Septoria linicola]